VAIEPVSNSTVPEHIAEACNQDTWNVLIDSPLANLKYQVTQSTSDAAPRLLAYIAYYLGAYQSSDIFHVYQELINAVSGPMAAKQRTAQKMAETATEKLEPIEEHAYSSDAQPAWLCSHLS
jgi:hypothetical protein